MTADAPVRVVGLRKAFGAILASGRIAFDTPRARLSSDEPARLYALHTEEAP